MFKHKAHGKKLYVILDGNVIMPKKLALMKDVIEMLDSDKEVCEIAAGCTRQKPFVHNHTSIGSAEIFGVKS